MAQSQSRRFIDLSPFLFLILIAAVLLWGEGLPLLLKQGMLAAAVSIKSFIILLLPALIFGLLFLAMQQLAAQASHLIFLIVGGVVVSNFIATFASQMIGRLVYTSAMTLNKPEDMAALQPLWQFEFPALIPNDRALIVGLVVGWVANRFLPQTSVTISRHLSQLTRTLLLVFKVSIPMFVVGFLVKLQHDGTLKTIFNDYAFIVFVVGFSQFIYIFMLYFVRNNFSIFATLGNIHSLTSALVCGFTTMSSAASMPYTIAAVQRNSHNKKLADIVIPATVNIHLLGDCIAIPIFAFAVLKSFHMPVPDLMTYLQFCFYFVLAKFSVAAIPAGGIIVMLPILQKYMAFSDSMLVMITALYVLFDPFITAMNILGNGALAGIIDRVLGLKARLN